ncbi:MAG TPA: hypothetical protein VJL89_06335, partial [Thermodesulfovibrionia bacterium]|nr:hypothetical protein [Thermodesulfovibrionia bacterium]
MEVQRLFRLSVWRPAKLIRKLDYILDNNEQSPSLAFEPERLHEQVYAWDPGRIDIFIGLDKNLSGMFRE